VQICHFPGAYWACDECVWTVEIGLMRLLLLLGGHRAIGVYMGYRYVGYIVMNLYESLHRGRM
jgi:hypothetical protein